MTCYAVIFSSQRSDADPEGYAEMAAEMERLARRQPGFIDIESARGTDGFGITVSYWESRQAIAAWGRHVDHLAAQQRGKERWYSAYRLRIVKVERETSFTVGGETVTPSSAS
jgi:heme-degrading monooxygenase HmoA